MRNYLIILSVLIFATTSCSQNKSTNYLIKVFEGEYDEIGAKTGYKNPQGDIVIPIGKYYYCFTDTLKDFAIVMDQSQKCIAIDINEDVLFEVFWYDNGPDYISDGLFRIIKNGKIGYANPKGEIVIEPKYECAEPFENGIAKVALSCTKTKMDEYTIENSNEWILINKQGEVVEKIEKSDTKETFVGSYRSVKGVMVDLSCYCFNSGFLTTENGEEIPICFEDDDIQIDCEKLEVKGYYKTIEINPEDTNPCPDGKKTIFIVESHKCK